MTITYRNVKNEALTYDEMDENIRDLYHDTTLQRVLTNGNTSNLVININIVNASNINVNSITANNLNVINSTVINETEIFVTTNVITANIVTANVINTSNLILGGANAITVIGSSSTQANTARDVANAAYAKANTANITADLAYNQANTARDQANAVQGISYTLFTANGNFVVPTGITTIFGIVIGGGGGGGANNGTTSQQGGYGAVATNFLTVTPGSTIQIGVGAGGTASNTTAGNAGKTSNLSSIISTGGTGGALAGTGRAADGAATGQFDINGKTNLGDFFISNITNDVPSAILNLIGANIAGRREIAYMLATCGRDRSASSAAGTSANVQYVSLTSTIAPGAGGKGETSAAGNNAAGGGDGIVAIFY